MPLPRFWFDYRQAAVPKYRYGDSNPGFRTENPN